MTDVDGRSLCAMTAVRPDRQAAHDAAVARGEAGYLDPDSGLFVMTSAYLLEKGPCCSSGCRHCPYRTSASEAEPTLSPERIVSLLPAMTDILWFLGIGDRVVGVTYECQVPDGDALPPKVTDTIIPIGASPAEIDEVIAKAVAEGGQLYELDRARLADLDPDLIITQDLCRVCALPAGDVTDAVATLGCSAEIFTYDPMTLDDVINGIAEIGALTGASIDAMERVSRLRERVAASRESAESRVRPRVLLLEWPDPAYGPGHWIPDQIHAAGGDPVLANPGGRSSAIAWEDVAASGAEVLVVAPCGLDDAQAAEQLEAVIARPELASLPAIVNGRVHALDGDRYIVRPGPSLIDGIVELARIIHPQGDS